ncbi:MAG: sensor histidine kinase [Planctomycetia bacterium]
MVPISRSSLAGRLVAPVVVLVLAAVAANVAFTAWWAVRQEAAAANERQRQVAETLVSSRVPLSAPILTALHRLTGDQYVVWDSAADRVGLATLPLQPDDVAAVRQRVESGSLSVSGTTYRVGTVRSGGVRPETVLVLSPTESVARATWSRVWPILAVAVATLGVFVPLGMRTTGRIARRLVEIDRHVERITAGEFGSVLSERYSGDEPDEIARLVRGVNRMSGTLASQRDSLLAGERQRLLGQVATGFAHEVRNAVTGARLAIDLHTRRCHPSTVAPADDTSLDVAVRQLDVLEEEVRGLLMLGRPSTPVATMFTVPELLTDVRDLVGPRSSHAGTQFTHEADHDLVIEGHREAVRAAMMNLALNGIEAAGRGGRVRMWGSRHGAAIHLGVDDSGPGPPASIRDVIHEPFVTGKPEGVGIGLTVAQSVAESHGGRLEWSRRDGMTCFVMVLPMAGSPATQTPKPREGSLS